MAETPKGDTVTPTEDAGPIRPAAASGAASSETTDTIAGDAGRDSLAVGSGEPEPADRPLTADRPAAAAREPRRDPAPERRGGGGLRPLLIVVVLLAVAGGAAYATYPMWRDQVAPHLARLGIALPGATGTPAPPAETSSSGPATPAPAPPAPATPAPATPAPATPAQATAEPALAGEVDSLAERLSALEQRVQEIERRPAPPVAETPAPEQTPAASPAAPSAELQERVDALAQRLGGVADEVAIMREGLAGTSGGEGNGAMAAQLADRLQSLTDRIAAVEQRAEPQQRLAERIEALESRPEAPSVPPERLEAAQARVEALSARLDDQARKGAEDATRIETRLSDLGGRLDEIAKDLQSVRSGREKAGAFLLAANQLAAAAATSDGFGPELEALRTTAPEDPDVASALEALAGHAGGAPSLTVLRQRFPSAASAAVDASVVGSGEGVIGQALTRIASLVTIRRTATASGDGLDAVLARAEAALAAGDLAAAVEAMRKLEGDPARATAGWLADAEARLALDRAVRAVQARALAGVAGG